MMVWLVGKCGCHDRSFSGILGPRLFLSPDNTVREPEKGSEALGNEKREK